MKRVIILFSLLAALALPALAQPSNARAEAVEITAAPASVAIGAFYNGTSLHIEGTLPEGAGLVLRFAGAPGEVAMKQKGKALGLLWMNMNTLRFAGVPKVFLVESSAPLGDLGQAGPGLGLEGLAAGIELSPESADRGLLLPELLKLKRGEGLYRETFTGVKLAPAEGGRQRFSAELAIPSRLSPGDYTLEAIAVKDGAVAGQTSRTLTAKLEGMPALMADLAFNNSLWYGVLASIIAIIAGLAIGLVFQSKGAH